jgi:hypothetical protein
MKLTTYELAWRVCYVRHRQKAGLWSPADVLKLKAAGFDFFGTAFGNKKKLIAMARNGESRPKGKMWNVLHRYISKYSGSYDADFDSELRLLVPDWFIDKVIANKSKLIDMAKVGEPRPRQNNSLGKAFCNYIKNGSLYDRRFDKQIRKLRPDWFVSQTDEAGEKKNAILAMAKRGESRPNRKHPLGIVLNNYMNSSIRGYDSDFDKKIRKLRPDWFVSSTDENKTLLLEMAESGKPKPKCGRNPLGGRLWGYTHSSRKSYDPDFDKRVRILRPDWFAKSSFENKDKILEMAKAKCSKPHYKKHPLGKALVCYTNSKSDCFDPDFDKKVRKLRPDWFVTQYNKASKKKQQLLKMAKNGEERPNQKKHKLGAVLGNYTKMKNGSYDLDFDKEIRALRPDWFTRSRSRRKA